MPKHRTSPAAEVTRFVSLLSVEYGDPFLNNKTDPLDEIVFIFLSEKTDEAKYLRAFQNLKSHYPRWEDLLSAPVSEIEKLIRVAGMGHRRAKLLHRLFQAIIARFGSLDLSALKLLSAQEAEDELMLLPGVGRKTARCVLLYCFGFQVLPVDIHTYRLAIRLGILSRRVSYEQSHSILQRHIPANKRYRFHVNAVAHGRVRCFARNPKCEGCPLKAYCSHPKAINPLPIGVRPNPMVVDLFAGAGGMSLGFERAGFHVVQAVERDARAAATYQHNNPDADVICRDITSLNPQACLQRLGLRPGDITALIGGIPCQGFSESNRRSRNSNNPKNHLYKEFLRFLRVILPTWFVVENVAGLRTMEGGVILRRIIQRCQSLGYKVAWKELNAADYGVPQLRRRIFIIGNRLDLPILFPVTTHGPGRKAYITVRKALDDLPKLKNGASVDYRSYEKMRPRLTQYQKLMRALMNGTNEVQGNRVTRSAEMIIQRYKHIGKGRNWEAIPIELMDNYEDASRCHTGIYHRLEWDKPSKVIGNFRKNMLIHPQQHRGLSVREAARLQSFPDDYEFLNSIGFQQQQVADAVPPLLAEAVARYIKGIEQSNKEAVTPRESCFTTLPKKGQK